MDLDKAVHFSLNLASAVHKVYQRNILGRQIFFYLMLLKFNVYPPFAISVNSLICLNCCHELFTY